MSYDRKKLSEYLSEILAHTTADSDACDPQAPHSVLGGGGTTIQVGNAFIGKTPDNGTPTLYVLEPALHAQNSFVNE